MSLLELFSGLGAAGMAWGGPVALAIDQNPYANEAYLLNHGLAPRALNLVGVKPEVLAAAGAERWWLSPPCQPFTVRGARRDLDDPRTRPLLRSLAAICVVKPRWVALENVPGFVQSSARGEVRAGLIEAGYTLTERLLCPTSLGIPMRRQRYYLVAELGGSGTHRSDFTGPPAIPPLRPLASYLDADPDPDLYLEPSTVRAYGHSVHLLDVADALGVANCFTSAYGSSPVRAGSYFLDSQGARYASPEEIVRLLGFPADWRFPPTLPREVRWDLAGNSLSVDAVRVVLRDAGALALEP